MGNPMNSKPFLSDDESKGSQPINSLKRWEQPPKAFLQKGFFIIAAMLVFNGFNGFWQENKTAMFLQLVVGGHLMLLVARSSGLFLKLVAPLRDSHGDHPRHPDLCEPLVPVRVARPGGGYLPAGDRSGVGL
jgi:hypothetical protein